MNKTGKWFVILGLVSLIGSVLIGLISAVHYVHPPLRDVLPFVRLRPMHVSLAVAWIFLVVIGGVYSYLPDITTSTWRYKNLLKIHFWVFLLFGIGAISALALGVFGGREYWAYPPLISMGIVLSWLLFGTNFFTSVKFNCKSWPVYQWMWATGIIFFLFTFTESNLWLLSHFRESVVRDLTVQWKSYGALVGSWNMLVYGTAIYLMEKIGGDKKYAHSNLGFALYFLGLANLMFGWAHHTYLIPSVPWLRHFAYVVSMTEWVILLRMLWLWKKSLKAQQPYLNLLSMRFLVATDMWVMFNLLLALLISIPALHVFTHGTHITVAHSMGTTIGINSTILFASICYLIEQSGIQRRFLKLNRVIFLIFNVSLGVFLIALLAAGWVKGTIGEEMLFGEMMVRLKPYFELFLAAGLFLAFSLLYLAVESINLLWKSLKGT